MLPVGSASEGDKKSGPGINARPVCQESPREAPMFYRVHRAPETTTRPHIRPPTTGMMQGQCQPGASRPPRRDAPRAAPGARAPVHDPTHASAPPTSRPARPNDSIGRGRSAPRRGRSPDSGTRAGTGPTANRGMPRALRTRAIVCRGSGMEGVCRGSREAGVGQPWRSTPGANTKGPRRVPAAARCAPAPGPRTHRPLR